MVALGMFVPGCCMLLINSFPHNDGLIIALTIVAVGFGGLIHAGTSVHTLDIGGQHTGLLFGLMNTTAQIPGIFAPVVTGYCVQRFGDEWGYRRVFWACAAMYFAGGAAFLGLASGRSV